MPTKSILKKPPQLNLEQLTAEWQFRLRLEDWDILTCWEPYCEIDGYGRTQTNLSSRTARVGLTPPDQIPQHHTVDDPEVTLVHELIHIKASDVLENQKGPTPILDSPLWECMIEHLAQALVAAKRGQDRIR